MNAEYPLHRIRPVGNTFPQKTDCASNKRSPLLPGRTTALGHHIIIDFFDCCPERLSNLKLIQETMLEAAEIAGTTIVNSLFHHFSPLGVSGVVIIKESHLTIHSWPEHCYAAIDFFTCGAGVELKKATDFIQDSLKAAHLVTTEILRG